MRCALSICGHQEEACGGAWERAGLGCAGDSGGLQAQAENVNERLGVVASFAGRDQPVQRASVAL